MICPFKVEGYCAHPSVPDKYACLGDDSDCQWIIDLGARITGIKKTIEKQCNQNGEKGKPI